MMPRGGKREGAGRPPKPADQLRKRCTLRAITDEWDLILRFAKIIKYGDKIAAEQFLNSQEALNNS